MGVVPLRHWHGPNREAQFLIVGNTQSKKQNYWTPFYNNLVGKFCFPVPVGLKGEGRLTDSSLAGPALVVVPVVPWNHSIFEKGAMAPLHFGDLMQSN